MSRRKNGQGTLIKLPNGKYKLLKMVGYNDNGGTRRISVTGTSETDCYKKMKDYEARMAGSSDPKRISKTTVTDLCHIHLKKDIEDEILKDSGMTRRKCTINNQIKLYPIGRLQVTTVDSNDICNHIETLIREKYSASTIEKALNVLNGAYTWACDRQIISYNPCKPVMKSLRKKLDKMNIKNSSAGMVVVLLGEQEEKLIRLIWKLTETSKRLYEIIWGLSILFLLYTGIRIGELCALRWRDFSPKTNTININKTRVVVENMKSKGERDKYITIENEVKNYHSRTIKLSDEAINIINKIYEITPLKGDDDYIIINRRRKPTNPKNLGNNINNLYEKFGFGVEIRGAHILRRTCATNMYYAGCDIAKIAAYLGDTPVTIREHYISITKRIVAGGEVLNVVEYPKKK